MPADSSIAAVVLAAGASRRFGEANKLLATIEGRTIIERVVDALTEGGVSEIVVVLGWDASAVETALASRQVRTVPNPSWEEGMGTSIATGIAALNRTQRAAFILPGDMGLLTSQVVAKLIEASATAGDDRIVFPTTRAGEQRNPVLWPRRYFGALLALPPQAGAKALLQLVATECLPVPLEEAALIDIDTASELEIARERSGP